MKVTNPITETQEASEHNPRRVCLLMAPAAPSSTTGYKLLAP